MFLALQEIRHAKWRYIAIAAVVFLVSYLVYFLAGLAWGLASSYTEVIKQWEAKSISITEASNRNPLASKIPESGLEVPKDSATLAMATAAIKDKTAPEDGPQRVNTYVFAVAPDSFLAPPVSSGRQLQNPNEVVVDDHLKLNGYHLGDKLSLPDTQTDFTIVGFSSATRFQAAPVIFINAAQRQDAWDNQNSQFVNAVINRANNHPSAPSEVQLETVSIADLIDELPGYRAQYLTFSLMIISMIAILSLVLGIFMYVLTLQKKNVFGIMKARGISTAYIARAGAYQTLLVSLTGVLLGMAVAIASGLALAPAVPFAVNWALFAIVTATFVVFTLLGSLFPIRVIAKIDPVAAIG